MPFMIGLIGTIFIGFSMDEFTLFAAAPIMIGSHYQLKLGEDAFQNLIDAFGTLGLWGLLITILGALYDSFFR